MSETVHYKGILQEVERINNETLEEQCKRLLDSKKLESYYDTYEEMLTTELYKQYIIYDKIVYEIVDKRSIDPDNDIFNISKNEDETFSFEVKYYNGGCGFEEAIEEAFKKYESE